MYIEQLERGKTSKTQVFPTSFDLATVHEGYSLFHRIIIFDIK